MDSHLDWAASQFLSEKIHVGVVGYVYQQLSGDSGSGAKLGSFESRVVGAGPEAGYFFGFGGHKGYVQAKTYWEWDGDHRQRAGIRGSRFCCRSGRPRDEPDHAENRFVDARIIRKEFMN